MSGKGELLEGTGHGEEVILLGARLINEPFVNKDCMICGQ